MMYSNIYGYLREQNGLLEAPLRIASNSELAAIRNITRQVQQVRERIQQYFPMVQTVKQLYLGDIITT